MLYAIGGHINLFPLNNLMIIFVPKFKFMR